MKLRYYSRRYGPDIPDGVEILNVTAISNPFNNHRGNEERLAAVRKHPLFESLVKQGVILLKTRGELWVGCTFGHHRSRAVAEEIGKRLGITAERIPDRPSTYGVGGR